MKGGSRGVETSVTPDEPDVLDAGDGVQGLGVGGLASGSSSASVFLVASAGARESGLCHQSDVA